MVEIRIVVEGGIVPHQNDSVLTINNSERLREAFHKLLSKIVSPVDFNLIVEVKGGYPKAVESFKTYAFTDSATSLLIDLDGAGSTKRVKLTNLSLESFEERVFFMVQEMEAWILSQPEIIEKCYENRYLRQKEEVRIEDDKIFSIHPEEIVKPSEKLKVILGRYYLEKKGNDMRKKKYGKLKDAPLLIENLDTNKLVEVFEDLKLLKRHIVKH